MKAIPFLLFLPLFFLITTGSLSAQEEEFGLASYYSDDFHGRKTAYGDYYDKDKLTAAHKKYPFGTKIKITRLDNNKSVTVTVTDKGPYIKGRVVDLSRRAAERIDLIRDGGIARVKVELAEKSAKQREAVTAAAPERPTSYDEPAPKPKAKEVAAVKETSTAPATTAEPEEKKTTKPKSESTSSSGEIKFKLVQQDYNQYGLYKIVLQKPEQKGYGVQIASLSNYENVLKQIADLQAKWFENILISVEKGGEKPTYKVILGPFEDEKTAEKYQADLNSKYKIKGFVIDLSLIEY